MNQYIPSHPEPASVKAGKVVKFNCCGFFFPLALSPLSVQAVFTKKFCFSSTPSQSKRWGASGREALCPIQKHPGIWWSGIAGAQREVWQQWVKNGERKGYVGEGPFSQPTTSGSRGGFMKKKNSKVRTSTIAADNPCRNICVTWELGHKTWQRKRASNCPLGSNPFTRRSIPRRRLCFAAVTMKSFCCVALLWKQTAPQTLRFEPPPSLVCWGFFNIGPQLTDQKKQFKNVTK